MVVRLVVTAMGVVLVAMFLWFLGYVTYLGLREFFRSRSKEGSK